MQQPPDPFAPEKLQLFIAGLSGLSTDEVRKAKVLYLRNAISELEAVRTSYAGFRVVQGCFAVIPIFWPILWAQKRTMDAHVRLSDARIRNAIDVWREDLAGERFVIGGEQVIV